MIYFLTNYQLYFKLSKNINFLVENVALEINNVLLIFVSIIEQVSFLLELIGKKTQGTKHE